MVTILLLSMMSLASEIRVAVIDTGFDATYSDKVKWCKDAPRISNLNDRHLDSPKHGTNVIGLINKYNKNPDVCFMLFELGSGLLDYIKTLSAATRSKAHIIHFSGGGHGFDLTETAVVKNYLNNGGLFIAALGNSRKDLNGNCDFYPACSDSRVFKITNQAVYSNKHKKALVMKKDGTKEPVFGTEMRGTSQSAAIFTGLLLTYLKDHPQWTK